MDKINFGKLAAILLLTGFVLLGTFLHTEWKEGRMFRDAVVTTGLVTDRYTTAASTRTGSPGTELRVRFRDAEGKVHEAEFQVEEDFWNTHPKGSPVRVRYLPPTARQSWLVGASSDDKWGMSKVGAASLLVILGLVAAWLHREYK